MWLEKKPLIALAPMANMTDSPFCQICRRVSGRNFVIFREMVSSEAIFRKNKKTLEMCEFTREERPIVLQIFGSDPLVMSEAARILVNKYRPDGIDVNMGCPVSKIARKGGSGAGLMKDHDKAYHIVQTLKAANLGVPVSVKTRLGWSDPAEILQFATGLEQVGVDAISIHARTRKQGYDVGADWRMIAKVAKLINIPLIANGDIKVQADIKRCLRTTDASGVMIGRAALGNPWIFGLATKPGYGEIARVVLEHAKLHEKRYGPGSVITFRKHLLMYFKGMEHAKKFRREMAKISNLTELKRILKKIKK